LIDRNTIIPSLLQRAAKLAIGDHLEARSYKRDRGFLIVREGEDRYRVIEDGFEQSDQRMLQGALRKHLKTLVKREFPRSHKIRVYDLGPFDELARWPQRKRI